MFRGNALHTGFHPDGYGVIMGIGGGFGPAPVAATPSSSNSNSPLSGRRLFIGPGGAALTNSESASASLSASSTPSVVAATPSSSPAPLPMISLGQRAFNFTTEGYVQSSPAIGADGTIFVGSYVTPVVAV
jgi:hypothetical protein